MTFFRYAALLCAAAVLAACSPTMNWRVVPNPDLLYVATFPDKPAQLTRTVPLNGMEVPLTLQAAEVDGLYFMVGTVVLAGELQGQGEAIRTALAQAAAANLGQPPQEAVPVQWLGRTAYSVKVGGQYPGTGGPAFLQARFLEHRGHVYQITVTGPGEGLNPDFEANWFGGFSLLGG